MKIARFRTKLLLASALGSAGLATSAAAQTAPAPVPAVTPPPAPASTPTPPSVSAARPLAAMGDNVTPQWRNIRTFSGDVSPYWRNIRTFWTDTGSTAGDVAAFWGNLRTFSDGTDAGSIVPAWRNIRTFSGNVGASWGDITSFWRNIRTFQDSPQDYTQLAGMLQGMVAQSQTAFGAQYQAQTGNSFQSGFANPLLAKYGIDLSNPSSLQTLDVDTREHFFLDWWDNLMNYSGADHADWWMKAVNWTPSLTQQVGMSGTNSTVGILDFSITGEAANNVVKYGGVSSIANGHGSAVASLIVDPIDGKGVMGIAPEASVIAYNPFDASQTADWPDITAGVAMLTKNGATIINMSLGVPGTTFDSGWNKVFQDKSVKASAQKQIFVMAAGNDGVTQTQNVTWANDNPQFIVVGSVDPLGTISSFSNRPGTVCLTSDSKGACTKDSDPLMNHYMVAPGEMILVSDGQGGVTRYSGTSFAAPLVSGTVALIQDRWPWLNGHPKDVVNIVLNSARDLGAPGVDPVYGHGELDVQAALSPLNWDALKVKQLVAGKVVDVALPTLRSATAVTRATWEPLGVYFTLFEDTGESFRDFAVPMSSKLTNQTVAVGNNQEQFMSYLVSRFTSWISPTSGPPAPGATAPKPLAFTDLNPVQANFAAIGGMTASFSMAPHITPLGFRSTGIGYDTAVHLASQDGRFGFDMGNGANAGIIGGQSGFGMSSDYDVENGGANPFIGFASGGSYARMTTRLAPGLHVSGAMTQRSLRLETSGMSLEQKLAFGRDPYRATAANLTFTYDPSPRFSTNLGYTMLHEDQAVLGMGSADRGDLPHGSTTDAATGSAQFRLLRTLLVSGSATVGRTRAGDRSSGLAVGSGGLVSSAYQVALEKGGVFGRADHLRLTLAQPMHIEKGSVDIRQIAVVDRETGELGVVTQQASIATAQRRLVGEMLYGRELMDGKGQVAVFGRANVAGRTSDFPALTMGGSFQLAF